MGRPFSFLDFNHLAFNQSGSAAAMARSSFFCKRISVEIAYRNSAHARALKRVKLLSRHGASALWLSGMPTQHCLRLLRHMF
jgi:hypothetical protein